MARQVSQQQAVQALLLTMAVVLQQWMRGSSCFCIQNSYSSMQMHRCSASSRQGSSRRLSSSSSNAARYQTCSLSSSSRSAGAGGQVTTQQQRGSEFRGMLAQLMGRWLLVATQAPHIQMLLHQMAAAVRHLTRCRAQHHHQQQQNVAWMQLLVLWGVQQIWMQVQRLILRQHCCTCLLARAHRSSRQQVHLCSSNQHAGCCSRSHRSSSSYRSCRVCLGCHKTSQLQGPASSKSSSQLQLGRLGAGRGHLW
jgi:hypothetical protein